MGRLITFSNKDKNSGTVAIREISDTDINEVKATVNQNALPQSSVTTSAASLTPDIDSFDLYKLTALAVNLTINAPTGTPVEGQILVFKFKATGLRTFTWNSIYQVGIGVVLPGSLVASKWQQLVFQYDATDNKWQLMGSNLEA